MTFVIFVEWREIFESFLFDVKLLIFKSRQENLEYKFKHLIKIIEKQQTFNFFVERTEGIVKRERERERQDFDPVNMVDPIPLRASAHEIWVKERKKKKRKEAREEKSSRRRDPFESCVRSGLPSG